MPTINAIHIADDASAWRALGFDVGDDGVCAIGTIAIRLTGRDSGRGIAGWSLRGIDGNADLDGLPTAPSAAPEREPAPAHPNGVDRVDHVVAFTPDRARTAAALEAAGLDLRRMRDEPTPAGGGFQAFFRLGEAILEVIEIPADAPRRPPPDAPARFWGLALRTQSMERSAQAIGQHLGEPRDAVQPGRQIATVRRSAGLALAIALMTPGPGAA